MSIKQPTNFLDSVFKRFKPEGESSLIFLEEGSFHLVAFVQDITSEEIEDYQTQELNWRVLLLNDTTHLCFALSGYSWNDAEINYFENTLSYDELCNASPQSQSLNFYLVDFDQKTTILERTYALDFNITNKILKGIKHQKDNGNDENNESILGEKWSDLVNALSGNGLPLIQQLTVDEEKRLVTIGADFTIEREAKEPRARWILRSFERMFGHKIKQYDFSIEVAYIVGNDVFWKYCLIPTPIVYFTELDKTREKLTQQLRLLGVGDELIDNYAEDSLQNMHIEHSSIHYTIMLNWRHSKGVYKFDSEILPKLYLTSLPINISPIIFTRLPEFCVYVETPDRKTWDGEPMQGFFAMCEETSSKTKLERFLYMLIDTGDENKLDKTYILQFSLVESSLEKTLESLTLFDWESSLREDLIDWVAPLFSQLLYLCSEEPEIDDLSGKNKAPVTPALKKTRKGYRLFAPDKISEWGCGWRTGKLIRNASKIQDDEDTSEEKNDAEIIVELSLRNRPRGHIRRAHFHTFYAGKKNASEREVRIKWLPMIKVNLKETGIANLPTVVKDVA
jgi:hypothetical protein